MLHTPNFCSALCRFYLNRTGENQHFEMWIIKEELSHVFFFLREKVGYQNIMAFPMHTFKSMIVFCFNMFSTFKY